MALRDKLNSLAATATEKANILAATATEKANSAIETGKLALKISGEEKKIAEFTFDIGDLIVDKLDAGETFDDEIMALYASIQACREVIAAAEAEQGVDRPAAATCANCGEELAPNAKFCANCGTKVEEPVVETVEAEVVETPEAPAE